MRVKKSAILMSYSNPIKQRQITEKHILQQIVALC